MKDDTENKGEICPHCITQTMPLSIVCTGCGATRHVGASFVNILISIVIGICLGMGIVEEIYTVPVWSIAWVIPAIGGLLLMAMCIFAEKGDIRWRQSFRSRTPFKKSLERLD